MKEIFLYFLKLGLLGFGGPLALIASIQKDCVEKKSWLTREDFNTAFSLIKAMPGPIAFMTAVFVGRARGGFLGALLAGIGLNLPAFILMILFSLFFKSASEKFSGTAAVMIGMQTVALGVILGSLKGLVKSYYTNLFFWSLVIVSGAINFNSPSLEPLVILIFGGLVVFIKNYNYRMNELATLFWVCFKAGALVFGSGLAIVPMLSHDVVTHYQWLTQSEFLDALAFGQMTPGPVVITATYIGHHIHGLTGAFIATVAIFLASFIHMTTWFPHVISKLKDKKWIASFIFGAIAAVVGPIIVAVIKLSMSLPLTYELMGLGILGFLITLSGKIPLWLVIPSGGLFYYLLF